MQALRVPCVPMAASQALHQLPVAFACLVGAIVTRTLPRHALSAHVGSTAQSRDGSAVATTAPMVATGLRLKASPLVHVTHVPRGNTLALAQPRAHRVLLALWMATKTQQLRARHARTEPTLDVARANVRLAPLGGLIWTTTRLRRAYNVGLVRYG